MNSASKTQRDALERWIACQLPACTHDELRVLGVRLERMAKARPDYGGLVIAADSRDWRREAAEEGVDRVFYEDCLYIARQDEARIELDARPPLELAPFETDTAEWGDEK